jgi:hypothetical protein
MPQLELPKAYSREDLKLGPSACMVVHPDGGRAYLGRSFSSYERQRRNLGVLKLSPAGDPLEEIEWHPDCHGDLPIDAFSTVMRLHLHRSRRKLYLASSLRYPYDHSPPSYSPPSSISKLTVYGVTPSGDLAGTPRSYEAGGPEHQLRAIAEHPSLPLLYVTSADDPVVRVFHTDGQGEPQGPAEPYGPTAELPQIGFLGKCEIAVSSDGNLLYLGTFPDTLKIVQLDAAGLPQLDKVESFAVPPGFLPDLPAGASRCLQFHYSPRALYWRRSLVDANPENPDVWPLIVWPLDADGKPVGPGGELVPQSFPEYAGRAEAVAADGNAIWIAADEHFADATGEVRTCGVAMLRVNLDAAGLPLDAAGGPVMPQRFITKFSQQGLLIDTGASQRPVLLTGAMPITFGGGRG